MKKYLLNLSLLATGILFFASCTQTSTPAGGNVGPSYADYFTINGGPFKNTVVSFKTVTSSSGYYDTVTHVTNLVVSGASGDSLNLGYLITFDGTKTGTLTVGTGSNFIEISTTSVNNASNVNLYSSDASGLLNIASYNNVGGKIVGTFSGGFNLNGSDIYTVSNGNFNVPRIGNK
jgi:hypothetical protein